MSLDFLRRQINLYHCTDCPAIKDAALSAIGSHFRLIRQETSTSPLSELERWEVLFWQETFRAAEKNPLSAVNSLCSYLSWSIELVGDYLLPCYGVFSLFDLTEEQLLDLWLQLDQLIRYTSYLHPIDSSLYELDDDDDDCFW